VSILYRRLIAFLLPLFFLRLLWRSRHDARLRQHWPERLGFYGPSLPQGAIWIHAVSVGETRAVVPLVRALQAAYPEIPLVMTHMTATGRATGETLFQGELPNVYLPYDSLGAVRRFLNRLAPRMGLIMETELWPNLLNESGYRGIPLALVNARLSEKSLAGYQRVSCLIREPLSHFAFVGAQTEADKVRLETLGAQRVSVTGNLKFESSIEAPPWDRQEALKAWLGNRSIFIWASTREGEEALLLNAWQAHPVANTLVVLIPRHPNRFKGVANLLDSHKINYLKRSEWSLTSPQVPPSVALVLGDTLGEMALWYALADLAYIGGSLVPLGGQNHLEALALGCPVLIGPHTFNFLEAARDAVASGAAERVETAEALMARAEELLRQPGLLSQRSLQGQAFVRQHQGATARTLALIRPLIRN
jgi:3-deoxy-D-manno-octulosonic-acid transferase